MGHHHPLCVLALQCRLFTAVAVYQLQERGLLNITDAVSMLIPAVMPAPHMGGALACSAWGAVLVRLEGHNVLWAMLF